MTADEARSHFSVARVACLATVGADARPHVVPIVFALAGATIYSAVDAKPKRTTALQRLANVAANPGVAVLVDHYDEDWAVLWWARADGLRTGPRRRATPKPADALRLLTRRYAQYQVRPPGGPVLAIDVERWSGWAATRYPA